MRYAVVILLTACSTSTSSPLAPLPVDAEAIRRACAMEVSCFPSPPPLSPGGTCVSQFELGLASGTGIFFGPSAQDIARYVSCANANNNCNDALNCASQSHGTDWCNAHPNGGCEGDSLIFCTGGWGLEIRDCAAFGDHCATANGASTCSDGNSCNTSMPERCDGNRVLDCDTNTMLESVIDCGALIAGGTCMTDNMSTSCAGSSSCSEGVTCQGTVAVTCSSGAQLTVDCGKFASHCMLDGNGGFNCVPDAGDCNATSPDSCSGDSLQICVNGKYELTPCSSFGLTTCQSAGGSARCQ